jgi:hypothetical protein
MVISMKKLFTLILLWSAALLSAGSELMLIDFEDPRQAKSFEGLQGNANSMTHIDDPALVISGKGTGKIFMPTGGQGENRWPRLLYRFPKHLRNWDSFDELRFDYTNPTPEYDRLTMSVLDQDAISYPFYGAKLDKKKGEIVWQLPEAIRGKEIRAIRFVIGDSPVERIVYIDNIRLTTSEESFQKKCAEFMRRIMRETTVDQWQNAGMAKEREDLIATVRAITDSKEDLLKRAEKLQQISAKYEELKIKMWQILCQKNVDELLRSGPKIGDAIAKLENMQELLKDADKRLETINSTRQGINLQEQRLQQLSKSVDSKFDDLKAITRSEIEKNPSVDGKHVTPAQRSSVRTLKRQGWTTAEIAKQLKLSQMEVELILEVPSDEL